MIIEIETLVNPYHSLEKNPRFIFLEKKSMHFFYSIVILINLIKSPACNSKSFNFTITNKESSNFDLTEVTIMSMILPFSKIPFAKPLISAIKMLKPAEQNTAHCSYTLGFREIEFNEKRNSKYFFENLVQIWKFWTKNFI